MKKSFISQHKSIASIRVYFISQYKSIASIRVSFILQYKSITIIKVSLISQNKGIASVTIHKTFNQIRRLQMWPTLYTSSGDNFDIMS